MHNEQLAGGFGIRTPTTTTNDPRRYQMLLSVLVRKAISDCRSAVQLARGRQLTTETFCLKYRQVDIISKDSACIASEFSSSRPPPPPPLTSLPSQLPPSPPPLSPSPPSTQVSSSLSLAPPLSAEPSPRHQTQKSKTKRALERIKLKMENKRVTMSGAAAK